MTVPNTAAKANRLEPMERRDLPDGEHGAAEPDRARSAGIDPTALSRLLDPMDPGERAAIREMCARDLETTRRATREALDDGNVDALARHLHVMFSLAQTIGAGELAEAAGGMQVRMRTGATEGFGELPRRLDRWAKRAASFLAEGTT